jgi:hypothetical protein
MSFLSAFEVKLPWSPASSHALFRLDAYAHDPDLLPISTFLPRLFLAFQYGSRILPPLYLCKYLFSFFRSQKSNGKSSSLQAVYKTPKYSWSDAILCLNNTMMLSLLYWRRVLWRPLASQTCQRTNWLEFWAGARSSRTSTRCEAANIWPENLVI